jgi:hypothetical protein
MLTQLLDLYCSVCIVKLTSILNKNNKYWYPERDLERDLELEQARQAATEATEEEEGVGAGIEAIVDTVVEEVLKDQETVSTAQTEKNKTRNISLKTKLQLLFYINLSSSPFLSFQFCLGLLPSYFQCWLHFCILPS